MTNTRRLEAEGDDERAVSLRLSDCVRDDPPNPIASLLIFKPTGAHDDRLILPVPGFVRRALETLAAAAGNRRITPGTVALWAVARGLDLLGSLPEVQTICAARAALLQLGSESIRQLDHWDFHLAARFGTPTRLFLRSVSPNDLRRCTAMATGVGLSTPGLGAVAVVVGLVDCELPGELPRLLLIELQELYRGLRERAAFADELRGRASEAPQLERRRVSWADVEQGNY